MMRTRVRRHVRHSAVYTDPTLIARSRAVKIKQMRAEIHRLELDLSTCLTRQTINDALISSRAGSLDTRTYLLRLERRILARFDQVHADLERLEMGR